MTLDQLARAEERNQLNASKSPKELKTKWLKAEGEAAEEFCSASPSRAKLQAFSDSVSPTFLGTLERMMNHPAVK